MLTRRREHCQRLLQISNQIIRVLDANRKPDQLVGDAHFLPVLGGNHRM